MWLGEIVSYAIIIKEIVIDSYVALCNDYNWCHAAADWHIGLLGISLVVHLTLPCQSPHSVSDSFFPIHLCLWAFLLCLTRFRLWLGPRFVSPAPSLISISCSSMFKNCLIIWFKHTKIDQMLNYTLTIISNHIAYFQSCCVSIATELHSTFVSFFFFLNIFWRLSNNLEHQ